MTDMPRLAAASVAGWGDLAAEFDCWREAGRRACLWWRDDDAVEPTPQLERLLAAAAEVPLALAAIPAEIRPEFAPFLEAQPRVAVLAHGWRHANHAGAGRKSEFPPGRAAAEAAAELRAGRERLAALFGPRALPVFVPPWNRFAPALLPLLPEAGFAALSGMAAATLPMLPAGLARIDVHLDPIAWREGGAFIGAEAALAALIGHLQARRRGDGAETGAVGILTHHLAMETEILDFLAGLAAAVRSHPAAEWVGVGDLLASP